MTGLVDRVFQLVLTTFDTTRAYIEDGGKLVATTSRRLLVWSPRILGILVSLFIGIFALDAFSRGAPVFEALPDFLVHLIPSFVLLAVVGASWRSEWIGGLVFIGLALLYALMAGTRVDWMLLISGPLMVVGALFLWSWRRRREGYAT